MLVAALEVDVGRPGQLRAHRQHRFVARTGVEPDVEDVHLAFEAGAAARAARQPLGDELLRRPLVPRVGAVCSNTAAVFSTSAGVTSASPHFTQSTAGIGTPQTRWREMHQSGRCATMLYMRSCPQDGIHRTWLSMASIAASRSVLSPEP